MISNEKLIDRLVERILENKEADWSPEELGIRKMIIDRMEKPKGQGMDPLTQDYLVRLRDEFAKAALAQVISGAVQMTPEAIAKTTYLVADEMLKARKGEK
jgi:hypothetical protein